MISTGAEGSLLGVALSKLSLLRQVSCCPRIAAFISVIGVDGFGIFQQQFLAIKGTGGGRKLSAGVIAFALTVVRTPGLLARLLPVADDRR
jgi:hypothetical protein